MIRYAFAIFALACLAIPSVADAQGLVGGVKRGARAGNRALGPVGGVVGGAVGGAVGTVNGALGIHPGRHGCYTRHHRRRCY